MKKLLFIFISLALSIQSLMAFGFSYDVKFSEEFIQKELTKKFPMEKKKFFMNFVFTDPVITLKDNSEFVYLKLNVNMNNGKKINTNTSVEFKSKISYENKSKNLTLVDFEVINIDNQHLSPKLNGLLKVVTQWVANKKLSGTPIYSLNDIKNTKIKKGTALVKNIFVKNKKMNVTVGF